MTQSLYLTHDSPPDFDACLPELGAESCKFWVSDGGYGLSLKEMGFRATHGHLWIPLPLNGELKVQSQADNEMRLIDLFSREKCVLSIPSLVNLGTKLLIFDRVTVFLLIDKFILFQQKKAIFFNSLDFLKFFIS